MPGFAELGFRRDGLPLNLAAAADVRSILIARRGQLVYEEYLGGADSEMLHDIRSAAKSITGTLVGIAIHEGAIGDLDARVLDFFPVAAATRMPEKEKLTLRHLLLMRSGLDADEDDPTSAGSEERMEAAQDWVRFALDTPMAADPGEQWAYASVNTVLLGHILSTATGRTLEEYAQEKLFRPLGIDRYRWHRAPLGHVVAQGNLSIRPRDLLAFGLMLLQSGRWEGRQLVPEAWICDATLAHTVLPADPATGYGDLYTGYGFHWWTGQEHVRGETLPTYFASGNGGQKLFVIPDLEMVVVITSSAYGKERAHWRSHAILRRCLAAVE